MGLRLTQRVGLRVLRHLTPSVTLHMSVEESCEHHKVGVEEQLCCTDQGADAGDCETGDCVGDSLATSLGPGSCLGNKLSSFPRVRGMCLHKLLLSLCSEKSDCSSASLVS